MHCRQHKQRPSRAIPSGTCLTLMPRLSTMRDSGSTGSTLAATVSGPCTLRRGWDYPMLFTGNPVVIQPNMVIFMHMILLDSTRGITMSPGETVLVTESGAERLSRMPLDLVVK